MVRMLLELNALSCFVTIHIWLLLLVSEHITGKILADALCLTIHCHDSWVKALVTAYRQGTLNIIRCM